MSNELYRRIGVSITLRTGLLVEFAQKLALQKQRDALDEQKFLQVVPEELREWIEDCCIVSNLFSYGRAEDKIYLPGHYGFDDFDDVQKKLKKLRAAWKGAVSIEWDDHSESGCVEVEFKALM